jgi:putative DNA methylase
MYRKKLIEVALPLEAINKASAKEKSIRHGHPSTLHLWWARRPLATCRAVLFASLVDDPSSHPEKFATEMEQEKERERLFGIIERLVIWENVNNKSVLDEAKTEIAIATGGRPPAIYDPFCGGGSIPLEAQRLGLEAIASDLNPVAVLITKALIEIPSKFANQAPVNPESRKNGMKKGSYPGALGLAVDIRYYGQWIRAKALERIGHLYPPVKQRDGTELPVVAWIWARTVQCPNPACQAQMPLVRSFQLSSKSGKEASVDPKVDHAQKTVSFEVRTGARKVDTGTVNRKGARCIVCGTTVKFDHVRAEAKAGRMSAALMAIVVDGKQGRAYADPNSAHEAVAKQAQPKWVPETDLPEKALGFRVQAYGMTKHRDLFTNRQLTALSTFSELIPEVHSQLIRDGATREYANAVVTYLAFAVDKMADTNCSLCSWQMDPPRLRATFGRQALPMTWDYAEAGIFADAAGDYGRCVGAVCEVIERLQSFGPASVSQLDASAETERRNPVVVSTDPPYYDNIGYADLSDFFYVWLRRSLFSIYPELFSTLLVPKAQELIATPFRFEGSKDKAREFFESGFGKAMGQIRRCQDANYPITVFYAFKQSETEEDTDEDATTSIASTGWETMLEGLLAADLQITGTWPMRSELASRNVGRDTNALASSIVLACRPRPVTAQLTTRKDFLASLKRELAPAIRTLQLGNIAPVDLQQAAIGPGMAIFSRYSRVIESDGSPMRVRVALGLINQALDEVLSEQESDYDPETRWALTWFEQNQFNEGAFGDANVLASAKALSVEGMQNAGLLLARAGKVRLLRREELPTSWHPSTDKHLTVWKVTQQLIQTLATQGQDDAAGLAIRLGGMADAARELAYRLYTLCERKGWAEEAGFYNALVIAWPAIRSQEFTLTGDK